MNCKIIPVPEFQKNVKTLKKKYRHIASDLQELNSLLSDNPCYGDSIEGLEGKVFKARLASSDMKAGKSKGYRLIYWLIRRICGLIQAPANCQVYDTRQFAGIPEIYNRTLFS